MESIWWFFLFVYTSSGIASSSSCKDYTGYMAHLVEIQSDTTTLGDRRVSYKHIAPAVILSDQWIITTSEIDELEIDIDGDVIIQFGVRQEIVFPDHSNTRAVLTKSASDQLTLIKLNESLPLESSQSTLKAAKLPPNKEFASQCQEPVMNGWKPSTMPTFTGLNSKITKLLCYKGTKATSTCSEKETEIKFPKDKCTFCFKGNRVKKLKYMKGNAILCKDDVLIGITFDTADDSDNIVEIGYYMKWIGETTGIKVAYQSEPEQQKTSSATIQANLKSQNSTTEEDHSPEFPSASSQRIPMGYFLLICLIVHLFNR